MHDSPRRPTDGRVSLVGPDESAERRDGSTGTEGLGASTANGAGHLLEGDERSASYDDALDEPALQRDLSPGEEREATIALERSRSRPTSQPLKTVIDDRRREVLESRDASLLQASTYSLLAFATLWGVLARLGLEWLGKFADGEVFYLIWPQLVGCLVMGFVVERKKGIEKT